MFFIPLSIDEAVGALDTGFDTVNLRRPAFTTHVPADACEALFGR